MVSCAKQPSKGKRLPQSKKPSAAKPVPTPIPKAPESLSPRRAASQKMVQLGQNYFDAGELDKAVQTFQEAINVDNENGLAYYFLAKALVQKQNYEDALGLLDRADTLLSENKEWVDEIERLRREVEEAKTAKPNSTAPAEGNYY